MMVESHYERPWPLVPADELRPPAPKPDVQKYDAGKPPMGLLSTKALVKIAEVLAFGAQKYSSHQWRSGIEWQRLLDAALRHLLAFNDGQDIDEETGLSHLAHLGCCVMFLLEFEDTHPELDNRYKVYTSTEARHQFRPPPWGESCYVCGRTKEADCHVR